MYKMLGPEVRVMVAEAVAIRSMVIVLVVVMGRPMVKPMPWMPMSSRGIQLVSLKRMNQDHLGIMSIGLTRLSQKTEIRNCSL